MLSLGLVGAGTAIEQNEKTLRDWYWMQVTAQSFRCYPTSWTPAQQITTALHPYRQHKWYRPFLHSWSARKSPYRTCQLDSEDLDRVHWNGQRNRKMSSPKDDRTGTTQPACFVWCLSCAPFVTTFSEFFSALSFSPAVLRFSLRTKKRWKGFRRYRYMFHRGLLVSNPLLVVSVSVVLAGEVPAQTAVVDFGCNLFC